MPTYQEFGRQYAQKILNEPNRAQASEIAKAINALVYESTKKPLSLDDKKRVLKEVREGFAYYRPDISWVLKSSDNKDYLDLLDHINDQLDKDK